MRPEQPPLPSLFDLLGREEGLKAVVDRFYGLMAQDPAYMALRAMHRRDLDAMKERLAEWLSGWLGGPPVYMTRPDATCIRHAHANLQIDEQMRDEWLHCMYRALDECTVPASVQARLRPALAAMAEFLRNH